MSGKMSPKFVVLCTLAVGAIYASGYAISQSPSTAMAAAQSQALAVDSAKGENAGNGAASNPTQAASSANRTNSTATNGTKSAPGASSPSQAKSASQTGAGGSSSARGAAKSTTQSSSQQTSSGSHSGAKSSTQTTTAAKSTSTASQAKPAVNTTQKYLDGTYSGSASNRIGTVDVAVIVRSGKISNVQITACDTHYPRSYIDPALPNYVVSHQITDPTTQQVPIVSGATLSSEDFYYAIIQAMSKAQNPHYKG